METEDRTIGYRSLKSPWETDTYDIEKNEEDDSIFAGAKFGEPYLTRDGRKAIFVYRHPSGYLLFAVEGCVNIEEYTKDGRFHNYGSSNNTESRWDIVSKCRKEIDDFAINKRKEVDDFAINKLAWYEAFTKYDIHSETENIIHHRDGFAEGFIAGYHRAKVNYEENNLIRID